MTAGLKNRVSREREREYCWVAAKNKIPRGFSKSLEASWLLRWVGSWPLLHDYFPFALPNKIFSHYIHSHKSVALLPPHTCFGGFILTASQIRWRSHPELLFSVAVTVVYRLNDAKNFIISINIKNSWVLCFFMAVLIWQYGVLWFVRTSRLVSSYLISFLIVSLFLNIFIWDVSHALDYDPSFLRSSSWTSRYSWRVTALGGPTEARIPKSVRESVKRRERKSNISKR